MALPHPAEERGLKMSWARQGRVGRGRTGGTMEGGGERGKRVGRGRTQQQLQGRGASRCTVRLNESAAEQVAGPVRGTGRQADEQ